MKEIKTAIKNLPKSPGIYQYFDIEGKLLYVGKAKDLNKRVKSYFYLTPELRPRYNEFSRIGKMLSEAKYIDYIVVNSEEDALILENSLIKQLKPKYNILLRDDKTYPYIYIDLSQDFPRFEITRKVIKGSKIKYFGPFPSGAKALLEAIYEFYPLVQKKGSLKNKKKCLFFEINKCLAPCEGKISKKEYEKIVNDAIEAIKNRKILLDKLNKKMESLANSLRFEEAAKIRDNIEAIKKLQLNSSIDFASSENYDIFAIVKGEYKGVVVKIFMREGKIVSSSHSFFSKVENFDINQAYKQALISHYKLSLTPDSKHIITAEEFEDINAAKEAISNILGKNIKIEAPKRGKKAKLIELALKNANELLKRNDKKDNLLSDIKDLLNLSETPYRIEVFDNSHLMGQATVGAMVV
jgi:excinuclease ABC subunit C